MFDSSRGTSAHPHADPKRDDPVGALYWGCVIHTTCILAFLRYRGGREAWGIRGALAFVLLLGCAAADPRMCWWVIAFLVAISAQRISTHRAIKSGAVIHSLYPGTPWLTKLPFFRKERDAMTLEMFVCFVMGALLLAVSHLMGVFLMLGFLTLALRHGIEEWVHERRLMRMQDAQIEGRWYGDNLRR